RGAAGHDLLHLALPTPAFSWLGDLVQLATSVPVVASFEGHLADVKLVLDAWQRPHALSTYLPLWVINNGLLGRFGAHLCATYAVSSEYQHQELIDLGFPPDRIAVVPNVVEDGKLTACEPRLARRE